MCVFCKPIQFYILPIMKHVSCLQKNLFLLLLCSVFSSLCFAQNIRIDSVKTTESRCEYSGTLTVYASLGSGNSINYRYQIIAPASDARSLQTSNQFTALGAGTYRIVAVDVTNGASDSINASITGNYQTMVPSATIINGDCISEGATVVMGVTGGLPPYRYQITSPVTGIPQTSNTFTHIPYNAPFTVRIFDSCGNFQSRIITPTATDIGAYNVTLGCLQWLDCDSFSLSYAINTAGASNHKYPYTLSFNNPDGTTTNSIIASGSTNGTLTATFRFKGTASDFVGLSVMNACGQSNNDVSSTALSDYLKMFAVAAPQCDGSYSYSFDKYDNSNTSCSHPRPATVTYSLYNTTGTLVAQQLNNSTFNAPVSGGGNNFKIVRETTCGNDTLTFNWSANPPALVISSPSITPKVCKEKVVGASFNVSNANGKVKLVFTSGPASVTLKTGVHTYTYPDTIYDYHNNDVINYLGAGTYKILAIDECGHADSTILNVNNSLTRHSTAVFTSNNGCPFSNQINWTVTSNTNINTGTVQIMPGNYTATINGSNGNGSYTSLDVGTYYCTFNYEGDNSADNKYLKNMAVLGCDAIVDTIVITSYTNPIFYGPSVTNCSGVQNDVMVFPDPSKGVQPFIFQIISGPEVRSAQSSPVFLNLPFGTYTFLMTDACGNSYQAQKQISALTPFAFQTIGNTCENQSAAFVAPTSPYVSYTWTRPDGGTFTGDTLIVNPVTAADTGIYHVRMIVNINGCIDTNYYDHVLPNFCNNIILPVNFMRFDVKIQGGGTLMEWTTANEISNKYFVVERSGDGKIFKEIGRMNTLAPNGFSTTPLQYTYYDSKPLVGKNAYRIKQVDINNKAIYSDIKQVYFDGGVMPSLYPNPSADKVTVTAEKGSIITVYNVMGQKMTLNIETNGIYRVLDIRHLPDGHYTIQVSNANGTDSYKLTVLH